MHYFYPYVTSSTSCAVRHIIYDFGVNGRTTGYVISLRYAENHLLLKANLCFSLSKAAHAENDSEMFDIMSFFLNRLYARCKSQRMMSCCHQKPFLG
ncbi:hypothetical protein EXN66_Car011568 [Channa argus]|uniref:Uncharacterized protein n=1 Tax=Channa argus TaxID=215402 RepID=A0A6G1Q067_CHAAH|nr:hypothetical protein EXN66_Car011568 [Channa argus]